MSRARTIWVMAGLYATMTFAGAFVLGVARVILVAPLVGPVMAVMLELPLTLALSWLVCGWVMSRPWANRALLDRAAMGAAAFALVLALEMGMALLLFGQTPAGALQGLAAPAGLLGLAGQAVFAFLPLAWRPKRGGASATPRPSPIERIVTCPAAWPHLDG